MSSYQSILTFFFFIFAVLNAVVQYFFPWYAGNTLLSLPLVVLGFLLAVSMLLNSNDSLEPKAAEEAFEAPST